MNLGRRIALRGIALLGLAFLLPACYDNRQVYIYNLNWYVDPVGGSDISGDGSPWAPFQTITRALQFTIPGDAVILATGTYSTTTNEVFPILVRPGVLVYGDPGTKGSTTTISGGGSYTITGGAQNGTKINVAIIMGANTQLQGVTVTNGSASGIGVVFDGDAGTLIQSTVTGCLASGVNVYQGVSPSISQCAISSNGAEGISTWDTSSPTLRQNSILNNGTDGVLANQASTPNLGDAVTSGQNTIQGNTGVGLNNATLLATPTQVDAIGNTWRIGVQGSDVTTGQYGSGVINGPQTKTAGNNYAITNAGASIQF